MDPGDWRRDVEQSLRDLPTLLHMLSLSPEDVLTGNTLAGALEAAETWPVLVPKPYLAKIERGNANDPLLRQVLPSPRERDEVPGFTDDPLDEFRTAREGHCLQKYTGRSLILASNCCAVHCRFCFRRHFPREMTAERVPSGGFNPAERLESVRNSPDIEEVILSGGDPFMLSDDEINRYVEEVCRIPAVRRLRIHTRLPVAVPDRITDALLDAIHVPGRLATYIVIHVNHPNEIDDAFRDSVTKLLDRGISVLSQSVLLCGVNDCPETLCRLFSELATLRVLPYYLHLLDRVRGAAHFDVSLERGRELIAEISERLPGYAVPRLVRELPGHTSKVFC